MITFAITNQCNLRCPSCYAGRDTHFSKSKPFRYASLETCEKVFAKITSLGLDSVVALFSYCEPLLHPDIDAVLNLAEKYNLSCTISSHLNVKKDWEKLLAHSSLKSLAISVSGYTQDVYERGHRGGRIDLVLRHMKEISIANKKAQKKIYVTFHQYTDNSNDEIQFTDLCRQYGFDLISNLALFRYSPWDVEQYLEGDSSEKTLKNIVNAQDPLLQDGIDNVLPRLIISKDIFYLPLQGLEHIPCKGEILGNIAIDIDGNVHHCCCLVPSSSNNIHRSIFDMTFEETLEIYTSLQLCRDCKSKGYHVQSELIPYVECSSLLLGKSLLPVGGNPSINEKIRHVLQTKKSFSVLKGKRIYIYGASTGECILGILQLCKHEIAGIIDDNPSLGGMTIQDFQVTPLKDLSKNDLESSVVIICFILRSNEALKKLKEKIVQCGASEVYTLYALFDLVDTKRE